MKRHVLAALVGSAVLLGGSIWVGAQSGRSPLEGAWEVQEITFVKPPANPPNKPMGMMIFSGNHYSMVFLQSSARPNLTQPEQAKATADQLQALWGPLTANAGTFQVSGNTVTTRARVAKNTQPMASGAFQEQTFALKGDALVLTTTKNDTGPATNPRTIRLTRAK